MHGPISAVVMPVSSYSSRRAASVLDSPPSIPPPGISHQSPLPGSAGSRACIKKIWLAGLSSTTRAAWRRSVQGNIKFGPYLPTLRPVLVIGLTGGIGAGKSTVAGLLAGRGAAVIDVAELGREVLARGGAPRGG